MSEHKVDWHISQRVDSLRACLKNETVVVRRDDLQVLADYADRVTDTLNEVQQRLGVQLLAEQKVVSRIKQQVEEGPLSPDGEETPLELKIIELLVRCGEHGGKP